MQTLILSTLLLASTVHAEVSQITVKRVSQDIYQSSGYHTYNQRRYIIQTEYCGESAYMDTPVSLVYDQYNSYNNKLVWSSGKTCRVKTVYTEVNK